MKDDNNFDEENLVTEQETENRKKYRRITMVIFSVVFLSVLLFVTPIPGLVNEFPGEITPCRSMVTADGKKDQHSGNFYVTSVSMKTPTGFEWLLAQFNDFSEIYSEQDVYGNNNASEEAKSMEIYMKTSENSAIYQASKLAKLNPKLKFEGIYVESFMEGSDFAKKLSVGDLVKTVDGKEFAKKDDLIKYIRGKKVGDKVTVGFIHNEKKGTAKGKLVQLKPAKNPGIGIELIDNNTTTNPKKVKIKAGNLGGPSGGLMFTLSIYQLITDQDLTRGRKIAGTGTMEVDGTVGRIGGIDKKIVAASSGGAQIFFAPDDKVTKEMKKADPKAKSNYQEAVEAGKKIKTKMKIVPVKKVEDALNYLE